MKDLSSEATSTSDRTGQDESSPVQTSPLSNARDDPGDATKEFPSVDQDLDEEDREHKHLLEALLLTIRHFFGDVPRLFDGVTDARVRHKCDYPLESLLFAGTLMFLCRLGARRQIALQFRNGRSCEKVKSLFGIEDFPHGDTLNGAFTKVDLHEMQEIVSGMTYQLVRSKVLDSYRLFGRFVVAIDGTGTLTFSVTRARTASRRSRDPKPGTTIMCSRPSS